MKAVLHETCFSTLVENRTLAKIRSFIDEVANGTSDYRSVHNLTQEVRHQYERRFLIELLQNAHDALYPLNDRKDEGRIRVILSPEALYVANDGQPFQDSNFEKLTAFGQSDKDPEKSIGNKGIGFRSVLEITDEPEIYSRAFHGNPRFDGYCFRFHPRTAWQFDKSIGLLLEGSDWPMSPFDKNVRLIDWTETRREMFRAQCLARGRNWIFEELRYLSPYLLPLPISIDEGNSIITSLMDEGYVTVVRLPLKANAFENAQSSIEDIQYTAALFLERLGMLSLDSGTARRKILRRQKRLGDQLHGRTVSIETVMPDKGSSRSTYLLWDRTIGGESDPAGMGRIREAVVELQGSWLDIRSATVSVAVRTGECPDAGQYYIFLPSPVPTGCGAHVNAPFFGNISRTNVDFTKKYNKLLLETAAGLAADVMKKSLVGRDLREARALVDFVSPVGSEGYQEEPWFARLWKSLPFLSIGWKSAFTEKNEWKPFPHVRLLPDRGEKFRLLTPGFIRRHSRFPLFNSGLESREERIRNLFRHLGIKPDPTEHEWKGTLERVASALKHRSEDWESFFSDCADLFRNAESLRDVKILPGIDNRLHAAGEGSTVFFRPGGDPSDMEELDEDTIESLPEGVSGRLTFLHPSVEVHEQTGRLRKTAALRYLSDGLVDKFETNSVLKALARGYENYPLPLESRSCQDVITWALNFVSQQKKRRPQGVPRVFGDLPAPCLGGWYPVKETCFGPGWEGTLGETTRDYLKVVKCKEQTGHLLLPPDAQEWGRNAADYRDLLKESGVFDGLRPLIIKPEAWKSDVCVSKYTSLPLPEVPPHGFSPRFWAKYREQAAPQIKVQYERRRDHRTGPLYVFPGFDEAEGLECTVAEKLCHLLLASLPQWDDNWKKMTLCVVEGDWDAGSCVSPLIYWLGNNDWLVSPDERERFKPRDRWFIPRTGKQSWQYGHLRTVPAVLVDTINSYHGTMELLESLGMPIYDLEKKTRSTLLLNDLATALDEYREKIVNNDVFLGQVRAAWECFYPEPNDALPEKVIVRKSGALECIKPDPLSPIYLQDTAEDHLTLDSDPVAEIQMTEVKRLRSRLKSVYGDGVRFASECQQVILSGEQPYAGMGEPFVESSLSWTIPVLLTIFSAYGTGSKGAHTATFSKVSERLRTCKIHWSDNLSIRIERSGKVLKMLAVQACWSPRHSALLASKACRENAALLSSAFQSLMEREELEVPIKLVLGHFRGPGVPEGDAILQALFELRIDRSRFEEVRQTLRGDLETVKRLSLLAALLYCPNLNMAVIKAATSENVILAELMRVGLEEMAAQALLDAATRASGTRHFGQIMHNIDSARFSLEAWNSVLESVGEPLVLNEESEEQFRGHLISARVVLLSVLRRIAESGSPLHFGDMMMKVLQPSCPEDLASKFWEVPFWASMSLVADLLDELGATKDEVEAVRSSHSATDLVEALGELGLDPNTDPIDIHAKNAASCREIIERMRKIAVTWCSKNGIDPTGWDFIETGETARSCLDDSAYLKELKEEELFSLLKNCLPKHVPQKPFWDLADEAANPGELMSLLSYGEGEIQGSGEFLEKYLKDQRVRKRSVNVAGREYDPVGKNMEDLWNHVMSCINEADIPEISPEDIVLLRTMPEPDKKPSGGSGGGAGRRTPYVNETKIKLIGTAGEMLAFRALQKKYGTQILHAGCWKSQISLKAFPGNVGVNDDLGYDFELMIDGIKYLIEVKSSEGAEDFFKLGPTQVVKATDVVASRKTRYRILRVTSALSSKPGFHFLPNPFDKKHACMFNVRGTDFNVMYNRHLGTNDLA